MTKSIPHSASDYLLTGYSCSQAMIMAYAERFGVPPEAAARLGTGFAGGMGQGKTCGAITGAVAVAGLALGSGRPFDRYANDRCALAAQELCHRFRQHHGSVACRELLKRHGFDFSDPEQMKTLREKGPCLAIVEDAQQILEEILRQGE